MKKYLVYIVSVIILVIAINLCFFYTFYKQQINYQKNILFQEAENCVNDIESSITFFESNINKILFTDDISQIFTDEAVKERTLQKLEIFYSTYGYLIKNIYVYDEDRNVLNLFQDKNKSFITDIYVAQRQRKLEEKERIVFREGVYQYSLPVFKNSAVVGNLVVSLDLENHIHAIIRKFYLENLLWQWIIDEKGNFLSADMNVDITGNIPVEVISNLKNGQKGFKIHSMTIGTKKQKLLSVYFPVALLKQHFGVVFSLNNNKIFKIINKYIFITGLLSFLVLSFFIFFLFRIITTKYKSEKKIAENLKEVIYVLENLPIGVMILNSARKLKSINKAARELLFIKKGEDITGKDISDRFMISKNYFQDEREGSAFDTNQFVLYQQEGNEVVIYKKETAFILDGEDVFLEAFIDVTSIEKSRKYEAAANTAKSEFLAKMSHEIRTPMNGIIGMTDALDQENLSPNQKEYIQIVRKSADLLLSIIDDILDFSKIESGKMQLEEIPFKLREEIKLSLDLFRPIVKEKDIKLETNISDNVPDYVIGDPFRLRQVLSNLISNAVKFTHEGIIQIGVKLEEFYNGNITLQFVIEDTGVGIPKQRLESIFNSFTQAEESTSRKYGGSGLGTTISKQLVNLMHGEIWVESPSSISTDPRFPGTKFQFTIEVFSNEKLEKDFDFSDIIEFSQLKTLIITKDSSNKKRLISFLDLYKISHFVYRYDNNKKENLVSLLSDNTNEFHFLLIIDEPNFSGLEIAKYLKDNKVIDKYLVFILSSNHKPDNYIQTKRAGVDYYLTQPFEHDELLGFLRENFVNALKIEINEEKTLNPNLLILIAEDNAINQKVAETIFGNLGYHIDIAANGQEALDMVQKKGYDIIFMDILMPEKDGIEATVEIRGNGHQMPIVAMTATATKKGKSMAIASGMNDYIIKPVKIDQIKRILYKWFT